MRSKMMTAACAVMAGGLFVGGVAAVASSGHGNNGNSQGHGNGGTHQPPARGHQKHHGQHGHHGWWFDSDWFEDRVGDTSSKVGALVHGAKHGARHGAEKVYDIGTGVVVVAKDKAGHVSGHVVDGKDWAMEWSHHHGAKAMDNAFDLKHLVLHKTGETVGTVFGAKHWALYKAFEAKHHGLHKAGETVGTVFGAKHWGLYKAFQAKHHAMAWAHHYGAGMVGKAFRAKHWAMDWSHHVGGAMTQKAWEAKHEAAGKAAEGIGTVHDHAGRAAATVMSHVPEVPEAPEAPEKPDVGVPEVGEILDHAPEPGEYEIVPDAHGIIGENQPEQPDPSGSFTSPQVTVSFENGSPNVTVETGSLQLGL